MDNTVDEAVPQLDQYIDDTLEKCYEVARYYTFYRQLDFSSDPSC